MAVFYSRQRCIHISLTEALMWELISLHEEDSKAYRLQDSLVYLELEVAIGQLVSN